MMILIISQILAQLLEPTLVCLFVKFSFIAVWYKLSKEVIQYMTYSMLRYVQLSYISKLTLTEESFLKSNFSQSL